VSLDEHRAALRAINRGDQPWPDANAGRIRNHALVLDIQSVKNTIHLSA